MIDEKMQLEFRRAANAGLAYEFVRLHATGANAVDFASEIARIRKEHRGRFKWIVDPVEPLLKVSSSPVVQYVVLSRLEAVNRKCKAGSTFLSLAADVATDVGVLILNDAAEHYQRYLATPPCEGDCNDCFEEGERILDDNGTCQLFVSSIAGAVALSAPHAINIRKMSRAPLTLAMLIHMIADAATIEHPASRGIIYKNFPQELRERLFERAEDLTSAAKNDVALLAEFPFCKPLIEDIIDEIEG